MMAFVIPEEISRIKADQRSTNKGKRSAVLAKNEHVRIVLAVLSRGEALQEHETEGQITVRSYGSNSFQRAQRATKSQRRRFVDPSARDSPLGGSAGRQRLRHYRVQSLEEAYSLMVAGKGPFPAGIALRGCRAADVADE
jgi:hypothetical protein